VRRLVTIALVLFLCAASAGAAPSGLAPKLVVSSGTGVVHVALFDAGAASTVTIQVPAADAIGAPVAGTRLGAATAVDAAGPLAGELVAAAASAGGCGVSAVQTWALHLTGGGRTLDLPLYVTSARTLVLCPATPFRSLTFAVSAIHAAAGRHRWTSGWASDGAIVEAQALDPGPLRLTTSVRRLHVSASGDAATYVRVSSRVAPAASAVLTTRANGRRVGGAHGSFLLARVRRAAVSVSAVVNGGAERAGVVFRDLGASGCVPVGVPCVGATLGGARLSARTVVEAMGR
jgi:hypothetical protein